MDDYGSDDKLSSSSTATTAASTTSTTDKQQQKLNYTLFSLESIELFASSVISTKSDNNSISNSNDNYNSNANNNNSNNSNQFGVESKVLGQLSEDTSYRLRELIATSYRFTRHSRRNKLTCDDVNKALQTSDYPSIYGYADGAKPLKEIYLPEAKVFVTQDEPINLINTSKSIINKTYKVNLIAESPQYRIDWLCADGRSIVNKEYNQPGLDEKPSPEYLQLMNIFNCISKGLISHNIKVFHKTLRGLSSQTNIQHILSMLVKFIANAILKQSDVKTIRQLLLSIRALSKNNYLQVTSDIYVTHLVKSVLHCILRGSSDHLSSSATTVTLPSTSLSAASSSSTSINDISDESSSFSFTLDADIWNLKDFAATILIEIFKQCSSSFVHNKVYNQIIRALLTCIRDPSQPYASHYGAIVTFTRLGFDCIINHLYPYITSYLNGLYISLENNLLASSHDTKGAQRVVGAWLVLATLCIRKFREMALQEDNSQFHYIVTELLSHFGDSLAIQLPTDYPDPRKVYTRHPVKNYRQPVPSGEELLDTFYETTNNHDRPKDGSGCDGSLSGIGGVVSDDDDLRSNSDSIDDRSIESEKDLMIRNDGADLLVESTISDPSLGVKLTIKKVRRPRRSIDDFDHHNHFSGAKTDNRKWKKPRVQNFMESFTEECEDLLLEEVKTKGNLYGHRFNKKTLSSPFNPTPWYLLANKLSSLGKKKRRKISTSYQWRTKLFSCNLSTIL